MCTNSIFFINSSTFCFHYAVLSVKFISREIKSQNDSVSFVNMNVEVTVLSLPAHKAYKNDNGNDNHGKMKSRRWLLDS